MPRGPKGERRPAEVIGNAVHVMRVLTGEKSEEHGASVSKKSQGRQSARRSSDALAEASKPGRRGPYKKRADRLNYRHLSIYFHWRFARA